MSSNPRTAIRAYSKLEIEQPLRDENPLFSEDGKALRITIGWLWCQLKEGRRHAKGGQIAEH
jgi:hypothetical protein